MKKVISLLLLVLMVTISIHAEDFQPILEDFQYSDMLSACVVNDESVDVPDGTSWLLEVSEFGNAVEITLFDSDYDVILNLPLYNVTAHSVYDDYGNFEGYFVTDDENDDQALIALIYADGLWVMVTEDEE